MRTRLFFLLGGLAALGLSGLLVQSHPAKASTTPIQSAFQRMKACERPPTASLLARAPVDPQASIGADSVVREFWIDRVFLPDGRVTQRVRVGHSGRPTASVGAPTLTINGANAHEGDEQQTGHVMCFLLHPHVALSGGEKLDVRFGASERGVTLTGALSFTVAAPAPLPASLVPPILIPPLNFSSEPPTAYDPGKAGEQRVSTLPYDFGDEFLDLPDWPAGKSEFRGAVYLPGAWAPRGFPLVVILHGRHISSFDPDHPEKLGTREWPKPAGNREIPNYLGHEALAKHLASRGFVVASISANAIAAADGDGEAYRGQIARARLIQRHLQLLADASVDYASMWVRYRWSADPFAGRLAGKIDMDKIGLLGHSRGAEAVLINTVINSGGASVFKAQTQVPLWLAPGSHGAGFKGAESDDKEFNIGAVMSVQPVLLANFPVNDVPMAVVTGYCDGDVDLLGVRHYEASRYSRQYFGGSPDLAPKHLINVMGANHNYFNALWDPQASLFPSHDDFLASGLRLMRDDHQRAQLPPHPFDYHCDIRDPSDPGNINKSNRLHGRLSGEQQRTVLNAYATAFFETYLKDDTRHLPVLTGENIKPFASTGLGPQDVMVSYHPPTTPAKRLDVASFDVYNTRWAPGGGFDYDARTLLNPSGGPDITDAAGQRLNPWSTSFGLDTQPLLGLRNSLVEPHARTFGFWGMGALRFMTKLRHQTFHGQEYDATPYAALQFRMNLDKTISNRSGIQQQIGDCLVLGSDNWSNDLRYVFSDCTSKNASVEYGSRRQGITSAGDFGCAAPRARILVTLVDRNGGTHTEDVNDHSAAAFIAPGAYRNGRRSIYNQVRIPLWRYAGKVNLAQISEITMDASECGNVGLADVMFVSS